MANWVVDNAMTPLPVSPTQLSRPVLRRATYVHVSDLTSAYNIDHAKLEQELTRVKSEREPVAATAKSSDLVQADTLPGGTSTELDTALSSSPQKRLQPPRGGYNLCVLVGKVTLVVDKRRVDQSRVRLAEVELGDETGTVSLRARDEQIDLLQDISQRSGAIVLRNCTLELYQGKHIRLAVTKWGKLSVYPDSVASTPPTPSKMNDDRNFSLIDLSLVASEMVDPQPDSAYGGRQAKALDSSDQGSRASSSKMAGQGNLKHQQSQSSSRKSSTGRDRRQSKGKQGASGGSTQKHYGGHSGDLNTIPPQPSPMRYHGMHPYAVYDQSMDPRQYPYSHARQHEQIMPPSSAQQLMMQRQFEMQQRQFQHMYHGQQERHRADLDPGHQIQSTGMVMQPLLPAASFDAAEYQLPSYPQTTSSPILIPMTMAATRGPAGVSNRVQSSDPRSGDMNDTSLSGQERDPHATQYMSVSPDDSQFSHGKMNPGATAFAPSYLTPQANPSPTHQLYFPYDPSQSSTGAPYPPQSHHHAVYSGGRVYVPTTHAGSKSPSGQSEPAAALPTSHSAVESDKGGGKENMKSG